MFTLGREVAGVCDEIRDILKDLVDHFECVYQARTDDGPDLEEEFLAGLDLLRLSQAEANSLEEGLTMEELRLAMRDLSKAKAPGSDVFPDKFLQTYSTTIVEKLLEVFLEAQRVGILTPTMHEGIICLMLKPGGVGRFPGRPLLIPSSYYK
ncbi:hypothetical protein NDU88_003572 [Pleurodeles waltl]|uniref:Uncharacterized protein n=1 Tax=Pleurodeles waltl TaxID=8319 RepID=A0AAV7TPZ8_PLEWA|nr:hypothetical protein NDU88_003572 [Pleurodeles waltl]